MSAKYLAVVNPAAGGGHCGRLAGEALERLRAAGVAMEVETTQRSGQAIQLARDAWQNGFRRFIAVGGDGTGFEILNGVLPLAGGERPLLGFLPLGTGNSFLRDFSERGVAYAAEALAADRPLRVDVIRAHYRGGVLHYINLLTLGFAAEVAALTNRRFKRLGEAGYWLAVVTRLANLEPRAFPLRVDAASGFDRRPCLMLVFANSRFTGGRMLIAPQADTADGLVEIVRLAPLGRLRLLWHLPRLYNGTHLELPQVERCAARRVDFELDGPVPVMVDGESLTLHLESLEVLPGVLDVIV